MKKAAFDKVAQLVVAVGGFEALVIGSPIEGLAKALEPLEGRNRRDHELLPVDLGALEAQFDGAQKPGFRRRNGAAAQTAGHALLVGGVVGFEHQRLEVTLGPFLDAPGAPAELADLGVDRVELGIGGHGPPEVRDRLLPPSEGETHLGQIAKEFRAVASRGEGVFQEPFRGLVLARAMDDEAHEVQGLGVARLALENLLADLLGLRDFVSQVVTQGRLVGALRAVHEKSFRRCRR